MTTRKDVAARAGVSEATVSHVINSTKYVSPDLERRVRDAIAALNYRPNMVARSLVTKTTKHVAIVVSDIKNPYYAEITEGMQEVASSHGYLVSLILMGRGDSAHDLEQLAYRYIDGVFVATIHNEANETVERFRQRGIAVAQNIGVDYSGAIDKMVNYLKQLGHCRIAFLCGLRLDEQNDRYPLFRAALKKHGLALDESLVVDGVPPYDTTIASGYDAMKRLLHSGADATAVFALNDLMAIGAMRAVRDAGLRVPDDISVVGCDDIYLADSVDPPLSTLRVPKGELGRRAMYQLLHMISEGRVKGELISVGAEFIVRESTGPAHLQR